MKRYYKKSIRRLFSPALDAEAEAAAAGMARTLTRLRSNPTGNQLETALFHVLDAALEKQAARLARERNRGRNPNRKPRHSAKRKGANHAGR